MAPVDDEIMSPWLVRNSLVNGPAEKLIGL